MENIIVVNGNELSFEQGETILEVASRAGIEIPTLCHLKGTTPTGTCRVCVVEVEGKGELVTACSTKAAWTKFQMEVQADDDADELCPAWGDCRLQELAYQYQVTGDRPVGERWDPVPMETVNPFIIRDFSRCIRCGRCVKACNEVQVNKAITCLEDSNGRITKIVAGNDKPLVESDCVFCGECVQACPVGALVEKDSRYKWRPREVKRVRTTCSYCGVGCQIELHVKDGRVVKVTGVDVPPNNGSLCVKGRFGYAFIGSEERLTKPLIKEQDGSFREATWDEAIKLVAERLYGIKEAVGPDSIGVFTSARMTNEENYLAHKFTRAVLKTNNIDHCARL